MQPSTIARRPVDAHVAALALAEGFTPFQSALIGARLSVSMIERAGTVARAIAPTLSQLDAPSSLPDIERAVERVVQAIEAGEVISVAVDHDADGISALTVLRLGLIDYLGVPADRIVSFTTDKLIEGYGISDAFVDRVLNHPQRPHLLITADQGSCDEPRIRRLRDAGVDTIVTDHHGMLPEGPPRSAIACVNPVRTDSQFPDPSIAGCHVAWLLIAAVRAHPRMQPRASARSLAELLDVVGLGTTCDCVSLANSINNRALVRAALRRMNSEQARPCWTALNRTAGRDPGATVDEGTLGYAFGPRCNASGRIASAMPGVRLLLATTDEEATEAAIELEENNTHRRAIQAGMVLDAEALAEAPLRSGDPVLVLWIPDGHIGVQGIVAAHMVRLAGRAVICVASPPRATELLSGSMRSLPGVHAKQLLDRVAQDNPGLLRKHGGHAGAAGLTIATTDFDAFRSAVMRAFHAIGAPLPTGPVHLVDAAPPQIATLATLEEIEALGPYGIDFPVPLLQGTFAIGARKTMGSDGTHLRVTLHQGATRHDAVWFGAGHRAHDLPERAIVMYRLSRNTWKGRTRVDMHIELIMEDPDAHQEGPTDETPLPATLARNDDIHGVQRRTAYS